MTAQTSCRFGWYGTEELTRSYRLQDTLGRDLVAIVDVTSLAVPHPTWWSFPTAD